MKPPRPSFRFRIALLSAVVSGVVLVAFGLVAWAWLRHERLASLDREIRALAFRHPGWMNARANYDRLGSAIEFIFGEERKGQLLVMAWELRGSVRFRSEHWPRELDPAVFDLELKDDPSVVSRSIEDPATEETDLPPTDAGERGPNRRGAGGGAGYGRSAGYGGVRAGGGTGFFTKTPRFMTVTTATNAWRFGILGNARDRLVVGLDCAAGNAELGRLRNRFLMALPWVLLLIGGASWWVAGQAVRPLRNIARAAELTTARGLDHRIPVSAEDPEIDRLIVVLNRMMDRLQASFRQATRFSADASHELKTPLAVMQGELEQALQLAGDGSRDQRVYASLLEETQRLKSIMRSLLLLAQADSGHLNLTREPFSLSDELDLVASDARILAEDADLEWEARILSGVVVSADRVLLRLAISNLLDNAIYYNRPGGHVVLELESASSGVRMRVTNTGPGIAPEEQPHVFDRFHRGAEARSRRREGSGLGLSLAREIVLAHGGELVLVESTAARTVFLLSLPG